MTTVITKPAKAIGMFLHTTYAVIFATVYFIFERLVFIALLPGYLLLKWSKLDKVIAKIPLSITLLTAITLFCLCTPDVQQFILALNYGVYLLISVFLLLLSLFMTAGFCLQKAPKTVNEIRDFVYKQWPEKWFATRLAEDIDAYFVRMVIQHTVLTVPPFIALIFPGMTSPFSFLFYIIALMIISGPHETLDHTNIHNRLFRSRDIENPKDRLIVKLLDQFHNFILNPLCMRIPQHYNVQHVHLHHGEDNGPEDNQSTLPYDRTSYFDFCKLAVKCSLDFVFAPNCS